MKNFIKFICFLLVLTAVFSIANYAFCVTDTSDTLHIRGFFKEKENTLDVLLIGSSELYTGFNSPLAWQEYGYTSYALTYSGFPGTLYEAALAQALTTQNPKLVVFEINGFLYSDKIMNRDAKLHNWFDNAPKNEITKEYIDKVIPEDKKLEYTVPFYKFHSNWKHPFVSASNLLGKLKLDLTGVSYSKSFSNNNEIRENNKFLDRKNYFTKSSNEALISLLDFCKEKGLEQVLFIRTPHCVNNKSPKTYKKIQKAVESYGYDFVNFEHSFDEIGLDTKYDFYNYDHLNVYGMEKHTKYLSEYFLNNYDIKTEHSQDTIDTWNMCAEKTARLVEKCKSDKRGKSYHEICAY